MRSETKRFREWFFDRFGCSYWPGGVTDETLRKLLKEAYKSGYLKGLKDSKAVPELTDKMIVAIEQTVENQLQASGINADPFRLDGEKIWYAAIEAGELK